MAQQTQIIITIIIKPMLKKHSKVKIICEEKIAHTQSKMMEHIYTLCILLVLLFTVCIFFEFSLRTSGLFVLFFFLVTQNKFLFVIPPLSLIMMLEALCCEWKAIAWTDKWHFPHLLLLFSSRNLSLSSQQPHGMKEEKRRRKAHFSFRCHIVLYKHRLR